MLASGGALLLSQSSGAGTASWLPRVDPIQRSPVPEDAVLPHRTILLAEPDTALRATWRSALSDMGFHVTEAASGTAALQIALHSEVSLLITELYLDSGTERCLVRAARRHGALGRLKILAVSRHASQEDRDWALAAGADAYLVKPVRLGQMMQIAARLAQTRRDTGRRQGRAAVDAARKSE